MSDRLPEDNIEELEFAFQGLSITIRRRPSAKAAVSGSTFACEPSTSSEPPELARVPLAGAGGPSESAAAASWEERLIDLDTPAALDTAELGPHEHFARRLTGAGGVWTARARSARAVRAGLTAAQKLSGEISVVQASPSLGLSNRVYICLRCRSHPRGFTTTSYRVYSNLVRGAGGEAFDPFRVSHSFPSRAEAEAYCAASGRPWPAEA